LVARDLNRSQVVPAPYESIKGLNHFDKVVNIDQSPIGRTPRSNPATYTGERDSNVCANKSRMSENTPV
jgi:excinuclease ABC subunit A